MFSIDALLQQPEGKTQSEDLEQRVHVHLSSTTLQTDRKLFAEVQSQGLPEFQYVEPGLYNRLSVFLKAPVLTSQKKIQSGAQSETQILNALTTTPLSASELVSVLALQSKTGAFKRALKALLAQNLIAYTLSDKPNSRLQKYKLTESGQQYLDTIIKQKVEGC